MRLDRHNPEIVEPSLGLIGAVADDEMVTPQGLVAHIVAHLGIGIGWGLLAEEDGILRVANGYRAVVHVFVEIHIDCLSQVARLNVGTSHVASHQRTFDVDFFLVADERIIRRFFHARCGDACKGYRKSEC